MTKTARHLWTFVLAVVLVGSGTLVFFIGQPERAGAGAGAQTPTASDALDQFNTVDLGVSREAIVSGGPPKDAIPALTDPRTAPASRADFMNDRDRVVSVTLAGQSRAYPIKILNWHEAINDELGGVPIAVVYCPLCDSVSVMDRQLDGVTLDFGISGLLYNSNVLFFDRTDNALWSQVGMAAISGPNAGRSLRHLPFEIVRFGAWKDQHPGSTVVDIDTGYRRRYEKNPYADYYNDQRLRFPVDPIDERMRPNVPVIGVKIGDTARAYPVSRIQQSPGGQVRDVIGGQQLVLTRDPALGRIAITQAPDDALMVHTFWFAWAAFHS